MGKIEIAMERGAVLFMASILLFAFALQMASAVSEEQETRLEGAQPERSEKDSQEAEMATRERAAKTRQSRADAGKGFKGGSPKEEYHHHRERHTKATKKVNELEIKLGVRKLRGASPMQVSDKYNKYAQSEREAKRKHKYPPVTTKEQAVK